MTPADAATERIAAVDAATDRIAAVDTAKGLGIVLVVFGHAVDGLLNAGLAGRGWQHAYDAVYAFHMPLFFVLAGLFVQQRIGGGAEGRRGFVAQLLSRIAWPYALWSVVQLAVIAALGGAVNAPQDLSAQRLLALLWQPTSQFWFLHALLLLHGLALLALPRIGAGALLALLAVGRVAVELIGMPPALEMPLRFGVFHALGVVIAPWLLRTLADAPRARLAGAGLAAAAVYVAALLPLLAAGVSSWNILALPAALGGSAAVLAWAALQRGRAAAAWSWLGRASMAIFVLHVFFVAGTRIVLHQRLGIADPALIALLATLAGVALPLALREAARRAGVAAALGLR